MLKKYEELLADLEELCKKALFIQEESKQESLVLAWIHLAIDNVTQHIAYHKKLAKDKAAKVPPPLAPPQPPAPAAEEEIKAPKQPKGETPAPENKDALGAKQREEYKNLMLEDNATLSLEELSAAREKAKAEPESDDSKLLIEVIDELIVAKTPKE